MQKMTCSLRFLALLTLVNLSALFAPSTSRTTRAERPLRRAGSAPAAPASDTRKRFSFSNISDSIKKLGRSNSAPAILRPNATPASAKPALSAKQIKAASTRLDKELALQQQHDTTKDESKKKAIEAKIKKLRAQTNKTVGYKDPQGTGTVHKGIKGPQGQTT